MKQLLHIVAAVFVVAAVNFTFSTAHAQGTAFTYQGQLQNGGAAALVFTAICSQLVWPFQTLAPKSIVTSPETRFHFLSARRATLCRKSFRPGPGPMFR
jgi:hypothetical protein